MTSPSLTSPVTYTKTWVDIFTDLDQWEDSARFYSVHARDLNTVRGFRRLCSPTIGHLVALHGGGVQLVHNIHDGSQDDLDTDRGELWALTGAVGEIGRRHQTSSRLRLHRHPRNLPGRKSQSHHEGDEASVTSTRSSTKKLRVNKSAQDNYRRILELSDEDDDGEAVDAREDASNTNDDVLFVQASVTLPNMLPRPGFLVAALMQAYTMEPSKLCLAAISAINARAVKASVDPASSALAKGAAYVAAWLWNIATNKARARLSLTQSTRKQTRGPVMFT
ncbi:hypothetical protein MHU86_14537 [Fragilaria crotonensis]|nr:hypothetical protein MHU86_14537 [Fragilaria crotonensis]